MADIFWSFSYDYKYRIYALGKQSLIDDNSSTTTAASKSWIDNIIVNGTKGVGESKVYKVSVIRL